MDQGSRIDIQIPGAVNSLRHSDTVLWSTHQLRNGNNGKIMLTDLRKGRMEDAI